MTKYYAKWNDRDFADLRALTRRNATLDEAAEITGRTKWALAAAAVKYLKYRDWFNAMRPPRYRGKRTAASGKWRTTIRTHNALRANWRVTDAFEGPALLVREVSYIGDNSGIEAAPATFMGCAFSGRVVERRSGVKWVQVSA